MNDVNLNNPTLKLVAGGSHRQAVSSADADSGRSPAAGAEVSQVSAAGRLLPQGAGSGQQAGLDEAVSQLNDYVQNVQRDLQFEVSSDLGQTVVRVVDQETQEVIRQMPDEVALRLAENLQQDEPLTLFNIKV